MESSSSKFVKRYLKLVNFRKPYLTEEINLKEIRKYDKPKPGRILRWKYKVILDEAVYGRVWHITPQKVTNDNVIYYLHGGGFVGGMVKQQWNTISEIARRAGSRLIIPDYPLAPEHAYSDALDMVRACYIELLEKTPSGKISFIGDSAGGGLMLSLAMVLRDEGVPLPSKLVGLSPWVDVSMTNPDASQLEYLDPMIAVPGLKRAGELYARGTSTTDFKVSPLYGDLNGLPPVYLFAGTHDILYPDEKLFAEKAISAGSEMHYIEYPQMIHAWMFLPVKEARRAIKEISDILDPRK